jgi:hypothetical protein
MKTLKGTLDRWKLTNKSSRYLVYLDTPGGVSLTITHKTKKIAITKANDIAQLLGYKGVNLTVLKGSDPTTV